MDSALINALIGLSGTVIGGLIVYLGGKRVNDANAAKSEKEIDDIEERITKAVLLRAEEQLAKYELENKKLHDENVEVKRTYRVLRMLVARLVYKMEQAGIDPELSDDERTALQDTDKLSRYTRK